MSNYSAVKCLFSEQDIYGCSAIHYAVLGGRLKALGWLIDIKCPFNSVMSKSINNECPLHYAARSEILRVTSVTSDREIIKLVYESEI